MKIGIIGAGAIGGMLGVRLALAGEDVTFVCRGANLAAARRQGFRLIEADDTESLAFPVRATDTMAEAGVQDVVILTMKAHQLPAAAAQVRSVMGPDTTVVTMQNGIPWWYFHKCGGPHEGMVIETVDPGGVIAANLDVDRVIGCVVYPAADMTRPAVVRHIEGDRLSVGELDGSESDRVRRISDLFRSAGFRAPVLRDIRGDIWVKLWGNVTFNPISALTHATLVDICQFAPARRLAAEMMAETQAVGEKLGIRFRVSLERRIAGAEGVGKHKTSMLQDVEHGRPLELDALVGPVVELGRLTSTPTPHLDAVYACARLLAKTLEVERGRLRLEPVAG